MITMNKRRSLPIAFLMILTFGGCASTDAGKTRAEGATAGALIGGVAGVLLGDNRNAAIVGAVVGAVAGDLYAKKVVRKKEQYANTEAYMTALIHDAEQTISTTQQERQLLADNLREQQQILEQLKKNNTDAEKLNEASQQQAKLLNADLEKTSALLTAVQDELQIQQMALAQERATLPVVLVSHSETAISGLMAEKRQLEVLKAQLASLDYRKLH